MKTSPNEKNAQAVKQKGGSVNGSGPGVKIFQRIRVPVTGEPSAARPIPVTWNGPDSNCMCDICAADRERRAAPSKRLDARELGSMIFWEAALTTALLEAIEDGVSPGEAVALAERHLKRVRALADQLMRSC